MWGQPGGKAGWEPARAFWQSNCQGAVTCPPRIVRGAVGRGLKTIWVGAFFSLGKEGLEGLEAVPATVSAARGDSEVTSSGTAQGAASLKSIRHVVALPE